MSTREQVIQAAAELRKLIDRLENEALSALDEPSMERLAAFDTHRRVIDSSLMILRRAVQRRVEREQSKTEPEDGADQTAPHTALKNTPASGSVPLGNKRPTTRPLK